MSTLLSINNYYYRRGGAETVFLEHNHMLEAEGWSVVPFAMHHPRNLESPWSRYFVDEIEFGNQYSLRQKLNHAGKVVYSLEARRKLAELLDVVRPDICHAHNIYHHLSPSILGLLHERRIPTVMTLHDLKIACPAYNMLSADGICERCKGGRLHNVLLHRCIKGSMALSAVIMVESILHRLLGSYRNDVDRFIVPSRFYVEKFCEWGFPRTLFRHVPNNVDSEQYSPQFLPGNSFVYFGRVSPEKGLRTLVRASAMSGSRVEIAGTGPQLDELQALATELGADVKFHGYLTGTALHDLIRSARAVVLPSEWYENAPMSVLEAYALGKPVIGAAIGGIPELVRHEQTGLTFESGDVESLAAALRRVAASGSGEIETLGRAARAWVEKEFSAPVYRSRILDVYRELGVAGGLK